MTIKKSIILFLSSTFLHYLLIFFFIKKFNLKKNNLFILSSFRWKKDLEVLEDSSEFNLIDFKQSELSLINNFYQFSSSNIKVKRNFKIFVKIFSKLFRVSAFVSCSCLYRVEKKLLDISNDIGIPFIAYHKEFTVLNSHFLKTRINNLRKRPSFNGSHILCINKKAKRLLLSSKIAKPQQISVVGLIRADKLIENFKKKEKREKKVVLFSFGHFTGPFLNPKHLNFKSIDHYFCPLNKNGFVKLFDSVHITFFKMSKMYPDIEFLIKTKNQNENWKKRIEQLAIYTGKELKDLKNCRIVNYEAQTLMNGSLANIVFNSTTVIESLLSRSNTIFPIYHEAKEEFSREIYFKNHLNLFSLAESEEKLEDLISKSIKGKELKKINFSDISSLCNEQLGNSDGKSAKRFFASIREILSKKKRKSFYRNTFGSY